MSRELNYVQHPWRTRLTWIAVYVVMICGALYGLYIVANRSRTHTIPVGTIELSIPYSRYLVGEPITFTVKNHFNSPVFITNQCPNEPFNVYRYENNTWVRIHDVASEKDCRDENRLEKVPANGSVSGSYEPWQNLFNKAGKYRIVIYVAYYNTLPYQDFEIIDKPAVPVVPTVKASIPTNTKNSIPTKTTQPTIIRPPNIEPNDD